MLRPLCRRFTGRQVLLPCWVQAGARQPQHTSHSGGSGQQYATTNSSPSVRQDGGLAQARGMLTPAAAGGGGSALQRFFSRAKDVVRARLMTEPATVAGLVDLMSDVSLEDLGLDGDAVSDPYAGALNLHLRDSRIKYMRIYEDHQMTFGMFCFPAGAVIPLHNHPGMTVLSRLMFGTMRVTAYDWVDQRAEPVLSGSARAKLVMDTTLRGGCAPLVLYPSTGGNLHEFTAQTPCVVLDLLSPAYAPPDRDCTYYRVQQPALTWPVPSGLFGQRPLAQKGPAAYDEIVELEVYEPHDFEVISGLYPGSPVV